MPSHRPKVLCFSGHDPSGGAGIQADIESIISHQCHCCSVLTTLTEQDSHNVKKLIPQQAAAIVSQAETVLADFKIAAIKIGLLGSYEAALAIQQILLAQRHLPVVLDPILAAGGGTALASEQLRTAIVELLLPLTTVLTPNSLEARALAGLDDLNACGHSLQAKGADYVLITGAHESSDLVHNRLFMPELKTQTYDWERLPHTYHGSGCTLAATIAALLAQGLDPFTAIGEAQDYTWETLAAAYQPGTGQYNPQRLFWVDA